MARAPYQVLILPYRIRDQKAEFCVFRRRDMGIWQFLAGGGEEEDASVTESAKREAFEEAGIPKTSSCVKLDTCCSIPASCFKNAEALWGRECFVVPEYAFAVRIGAFSLQLSDEHTESAWMAYEDAQAVLRYDSNRTALWELNRRIELGLLE